jgi:hypothetical protein
MRLHYRRIVRSVDGRTWTVEREVMPRAEHRRRPYAHELDGDRIWRWSVAYCFAPALVVSFFLFRSVLVPELAALALALIAWVAGCVGLWRRLRGRMPWKVVASTPPTEYEHGRAVAWAVIGDEASRQAVDACAEALDAGLEPAELNLGPPMSV